MNYKIDVENVGPKALWDILTTLKRKGIKYKISSAEGQELIMWSKKDDVLSKLNENVVDLI